MKLSLGTEALGEGIAGLPTTCEHRWLHTDAESTHCPAMASCCSAHHPQRGKHTQGVTVSSWPLAEAATCTQNLAHEKMLSIINYKGSTNQTPMRCHLIPIRIAVMKKRTNNKCWPEHGEKGTLLHSWWECKLVQSPQKTVWKFLKKLKIELPYDSAIPVLDIYPKKMKTLIQKDICT